VALAFFASTFLVSMRGMYASTIFLLPLCVFGFQDLSKRWKKLFLVFLFAFFVWNLLTWWADIYFRLFEVCP